MNNPPPPPYPTLPDVTTTQSMQQQQQQQQPGMTQHLREVRKNIQHRWSAGSPTGAPPGSHPEEQHLLSADAQDTPPGCGSGSPVPAARASFHAAATSLLNPPPPPSTAQLQMVINDDDDGGKFLFRFPGGNPGTTGDHLLIANAAAANDKKICCEGIVMPPVLHFISPHGIEGRFREGEAKIDFLSDSKGISLPRSVS